MIALQICIYYLLTLALPKSFYMPLNEDTVLTENETNKAFKNCELIIVCLLLSVISIIIGVIQNYFS